MKKALVAIAGLALFCGAMVSPLAVAGASEAPRVGEQVDAGGDCVTRSLVSLLRAADGSAKEADVFQPGDTVTVVGYGFKPCREYEMYIQPYVTGVHVTEGDQLDPALDPGGLAPLTVNSGPMGVIGPVDLWTVPPEGYAGTYWEIVADYAGVDCGGVGIYNADEDGLDAVCLDREGFVVVPEAPTIVLLSLSLLVFGGVYVARKRNSLHGWCRRSIH